MKPNLASHKLSHLSGNHEEPQEPVGEEHLHLLVVAGQVALGVVALVRVSPAPLEPTGCQLVGSQRAGARGETENKKTMNNMRTAVTGTVGLSFLTM